MIDTFYQALAILRTKIGNLVETSLLYMGNAWSVSGISEGEASWAYSWEVAHHNASIYHVS